MALAETLVYKVYTSLAGTIATVGTHKLLTAGWRFVTGEEPPEPTDPDADVRTAILWALASAAGLAATQVIAQRIGNRYLYSSSGAKPKFRKIAMKI
ncbi:Protein of unknown function [Raineyella antarctica]|uniref:DUF4235 domain-containing protein n=1 Tax=Raineyella antarctica TaxID=1577474 RepID=A0A1G6GPW1_9ACTN|nr:DUF4235 domain-containing protein [Raineyella antarctica]SDB84050.1 Protein of unknown function [Raineyella antarctica]